MVTQPSDRSTQRAEFLDQLRIGVGSCGSAEQRILLGVSGGADSMAMLRGLVELQPEFRFDVRVGHLDHGLRGAAAKQDADWLANLCREFQIRCIFVETAVREIAEASGLSVEEAARNERYRFLEGVARREECAQIVVAHTADDQAETILHHIIRGTGTAGLRGMQRCRRLPSGTSLVRPLLEISRTTIEDYLAALPQDFRQDASNFDTSLTRNRLRESLLPLLEQEYNPRVREALRSLGKQAAEIEEALNELAADLLRHAVEDRTDQLVRINCDVLLGQPRHLIRQCFTCLWRDAGWPRQHLAFEHWDRLAELVLTGGAVTLPGQIEARRRGCLLVLTNRLRMS